MRDFLYSEIANWYGVPNFPDHPEKAIYTGTQLCKQLLEPLQEKFGRIAIRSAYRSPQVNQLGNEKDITVLAMKKLCQPYLGLSRRKGLRRNSVYSHSFISRTV